jgi:hypothetical protein
MQLGSRHDLNVASRPEPRTDQYPRRPRGL